MKKIIFVLPLLAMMVVGCSNPTNTETSEQNKTVETTTQQTPEPAATPTVPQQPQTPVQPETPETPVTTTPTEPETPVVPEAPSEPQTPEEPVTPTQPEQPTTPQQPETPTQPETPIQPEQPQQTQTPTAQEDKSPYEYVLPNGVDYNDYTYIGDYVFSDLYDFANCVWFNGTVNSEYGYFMVLEKIARVQYTGSGTPFALWDIDNDTYPPLEKGTSYKIYLKKTYLASNPGTTLSNGHVRIINTFGVTRDKNPDRNTFVIYAVNNTYSSFYIQGDVKVNDYSPIQ